MAAWISHLLGGEDTCAPALQEDGHPCPSPWPVWHLLILTLLQPMKQPLCLAILKEINKATKTSDEDEGRGIFSFSLFLHFFFYKGTQTQPQTDLSLRLCICRFKQQYGEFHMSVSWAYSYVLNWVYNFLLRVLCNRKKKTTDHKVICIVRNKWTSETCYTSTTWAFYKGIFII